MSRIIGFFRRWQNLPVLLIPLLLLVWAQFVAPPLGSASFTAVALFDSPYRRPLPLGEPAEAVTENVVIIVIDGLREDISRQMPSLNALREQGADRVALVGQPSFSLPGWTVLGTGAWQEQSGITTNFTEDRIMLDTLFESAKRAGLTTAIVGHEQWGQLYPVGIDIQRYFEESHDVYTNLEADLEFDRIVTDAALEVLADQPNLTLIHLLGIDSVSHGWGALTPEAQQAVANVDEQLDRILSSLNLTTTAVFVTADHGHIDRGGHGGWEDEVLRIPLVSSGQGILPGQYALAAQVDVAPTVAALLGVSIPAHNQGIILFDQLDMPGALKAARAVDLAEQTALRYDSMLATIHDEHRVDREPIAAAQMSLDVGDNAGAQTLSQQSVDDAHALWEKARLDRISKERVSNGTIALAFLIAPMIYFIWWWRARWNWRAPLVGTVVYFVLWHISYFVLNGFTYSISMFNIEDYIALFITGRVIEALIILTISVFVVAVLRRRAPPGEIARDVVHTMLLIALVLGAQILLFAVMWDILPSWYLPDLQWAFKYYIDLYQTTAFWPMLPVPAALILPLLALGVAAIARRVLPGRR